MTMYCGKLCSLILAENFGSIVQTVGNALFKYGTQPLGMVQINSGLSLPQVYKLLTLRNLHTLTVNYSTDLISRSKNHCVC